MQYRVLGRTGLRVSQIGFGGAVVGIPNYIEPWDPREAACRQTVVEALDHALDRGLNYLDTAEGYGDGMSEETMGLVIPRRRDECIVATKVSSREPAQIRCSCEASLRRLRTDVIDVYQFHGGWYDPEDVSAILDRGGLETLQALREEGKVRFLGFTAEAPTDGVSRLIDTGAFDVLQVRYNLMYQHACDYVNGRGVMLEAKARDLGVVVMRPLTSGTFQKLVRIACPTLDAHLDIHRLLLAYVLSNPCVDVALVGMRRAAEVDGNLAVCDDLTSRFDLEDLHHRFAEPAEGVEGR
jgi:aryl-alcohol dehydrogenase-like predicted oxidoreductase